MKNTYHVIQLINVITIYFFKCLPKLSLRAIDIHRMKNEHYHGN